MYGPCKTLGATIIGYISLRDIPQKNLFIHNSLKASKSIKKISEKKIIHSTKFKIF